MAHSLRSGVRAAAPRTLPAGDVIFHRQTVISPDLPTPGTVDLVGQILADYAYHLPLDCHTPDAGALVRGLTSLPEPGLTTHPGPGRRRRGRRSSGHRRRGDARPGDPGAGLLVRHRRRIGRLWQALRLAKAKHHGSGRP
jgi:hypothetical protein